MILTNLPQSIVISKKLSVTIMMIEAARFLTRTFSANKNVEEKYRFSAFVHATLVIRAISQLCQTKIDNRFSNPLFMPGVIWNGFCFFVEAIGDFFWKKTSLS